MNMIKTAYVSKVGRAYKLSNHFKLYEMQCKSGADKVLYSTELIDMLEKLRAYGGFTININSGYRTKVHNARIRGAKASQHLLGTAADIVVRKNGAVVNTKKLCCLCQTLGFKGVAYISANAIHVDMRSSGTYRGDERKGYGGNVNGDFYKYFGISKKEITAMKVSQGKSTKEIENESEGEEEVTQEQFNKMMDTYLETKAKATASVWSENERKWAEEQGIVKGDGTGMKYGRLVTMEELVTLLYRAFVKR